MLKKIVHKLIHEGIKISNYQGIKPYNVKNDLLGALFNRLKSAGLEVRTVFDVGANTGTWTRETLQHFPHASFHLFEPQEWLKKEFQDLLDTQKNVHFNAVGVGKVSGTFQFTIAKRNDSSNFRLNAEEARNKGLEQIEVPVVTLDEYLATHNLEAPELLKIDAEGLDLEVLKGAEKLLGETEVIMIEAGIVNKNIENSILAVLNYMNEKGYILFDITDINRQFEDRVFWLTELVFVKKGGIVDQKKWKA